MDHLKPLLTWLNIAALVGLLCLAAHFYLKSLVDGAIIHYHNTVIVPMTRPAAPPPGGR